MSIDMDAIERAHDAEIRALMDLLTELQTHDAKGYGPWTSGMRRRVREALGQAVENPDAEFGDVGIKGADDLAEAWKSHGLGPETLIMQFDAMRKRWGERDALSMIAYAILIVGGERVATDEPEHTCEPPPRDPEPGTLAHMLNSSLVRQALLDYVFDALVCEPVDTRCCPRTKKEAP